MKKENLSQNTNETVSNNDIVSLVEAYKTKMSNFIHILKTNPESLTIRDFEEHDDSYRFCFNKNFGLIESPKIVNYTIKEREIRSYNNGFMTINRIPEIIYSLSKDSLSLLFLLSQTVSVDTMKIRNKHNEIIRDKTQLRKDFDIKRSAWDRIKKDNDKYKFIAEGRLYRGRKIIKKYLLLNPLFMNSHGFLTDEQFILFHESIKPYMDIFDYWFLWHKNKEYIINN